MITATLRLSINCVTKVLIIFNVQIGFYVKCQPDFLKRSLTDCGSAIRAETVEIRLFGDR
jgi:hypothetical protein